MGLLDHIDDEPPFGSLLDDGLPLLARPTWPFGYLFGRESPQGADQIQQAPPSKGDRANDWSNQNVPQAQGPIWGGDGAMAQGQTSPVLPQWLQTVPDQYRSALPMAGLTQAQFDKRFYGETDGSNSAGNIQSTTQSDAGVRGSSRFDDAFDPQAYAMNNVSPSWSQHGEGKSSGLRLTLPRSGSPRVIIPTNGLPVVDVTADQSPPTANEGGSVLGVAKALGTGLERGAIGFVGLPGDAVELGKRLLGYKASETPFLGSEHLQNLYEKNVHEFYKPKGTAEEYAETLGSFLPAAIGAPETIPMRFLTRVVPPALASEAAAQYYKGTDNEKRARIAAAIIAGGGASALTARLRPPPLRPQPDSVSISSAPGWAGHAFSHIDRNPALSAIWYGQAAASRASKNDVARRHEREAQ